MINKKQFLICGMRQLLSLCHELECGSPKQSNLPSVSANLSSVLSLRNYGLCPPTPLWTHFLESLMCTTVIKIIYQGRNRVKESCIVMLPRKPVRQKEV